MKGSEQQVSDKFKKREFVITENSSQYPQHISFQLTQDRCALLEPFKEGAEIKVFFNLRGREWTSPETRETCFCPLPLVSASSAGEYYRGPGKPASPLQEASGRTAPTGR